MSEVLRHVIESISPASQAQGEAARGNVASAGAPVLERLAYALGSAQHTARPRAARRAIVVVAGDHGVGDPGITMGVDHPTIIAAQAIAAGSAALAQIARPSRAPILIVDAGVREAAHMPEAAIRLGRRPSHDLMAGPAMTPVDAVLGLEAGIALSVSVSETAAEPGGPAKLGTVPRIDVLVLGAVGVGAEVASAALLGAVTGRPPAGLGDDIAELAGARGAQQRTGGGVDLLASYGGPDTAVLAGMILGAASMNTAIVLDGAATGAAALVAAALAPAVTGYLIAAHRGNFTHPALLAHLGLAPIFEVGLGHGEGTGAAMLLPLLDQVEAIAGRY